LLQKDKVFFLVILRNHTDVARDLYVRMGESALSFRGTSPLDGRHRRLPALAVSLEPTNIVDARAWLSVQSGLLPLRQALWVESGILCLGTVPLAGDRTLTKISGLYIQVNGSLK